MASPWQGCPPQRGEQSRTPFGPADVRVRFVPVTTILSGTHSAAKIAVGRLAHTIFTCHIPSSKFVVKPGSASRFHAAVGPIGTTAYCVRVQTRSTISTNMFMSQVIERWQQSGQVEYLFTMRGWAQRETGESLSRDTTLPLQDHMNMESPPTQIDLQK